MVRWLLTRCCCGIGHRAHIMQKLQGQELDSIFVCTGGGGMLAGIASYIKAVRPEVKVIGVEAADAAGIYI